MRLIFYSLFLYGIIFGQGFVHVEDGEIVDGNGEPLLLRGFGLGGWLVPEGYMLHNLGWIEGFESPTQIEGHIEALIGEELAKRAKEKKISEVYFDRGENKYHGRVKTLAEALRKNGLKF